MEIRNIVNEVKNEYPKMEQVSQKHLINSIPDKWLKVGLSSISILMLMKNNVFASSIDISSTIAGAFPVPAPIKICDAICPIVQIVSIIVFIITGLSILITKIKFKKQNDSKKVNKWLKVLFLISIIVFILSILIYEYFFDIYHYIMKNF